MKSVAHNKSEWHDMSNYVVHFTKNYGGTDAYHNMLEILGGRELKAVNPFGIGRFKAPVAESQRCACFSEVPAHLLSRVADKRSDYGIGFSKSFAVANGANPILYAYKDGELIHQFHHLMLASANDPVAPVWKIAPFIDAPGEYGPSDYFFEWEREWRKVGNLTFTEVDAAFLIIPEPLHGKARSFFEDARLQNTGPCYDCPYIDAHWSLNKVKAALG
jgi:hypothetical protein